MAEVKNVWTSLDVEVKIDCDCGEEIELNGTQDNHTCDCGVEYQSFIGSNNNEYTVLVKKDGEEIHEEDVCFR